MEKYDSTKVWKWVLDRADTRNCTKVFFIISFCTILLCFGVASDNKTAGFGIHWPLILLGVVYTFFNIVMSIVAVIREKKYMQYFLLPFIFLSLHLAYGIGTIVGIIKMPFWVRGLKKEKPN